MIDMTKAHQMAAAAANAAVPAFELASPEHKKWLAQYAKEFSRKMIMAVDL